MAQLTRAQAFAAKGMVLYEDQWRCPVCGYTPGKEKIAKEIKKYKIHLDNSIHLEGILIAAALSAGLVPVNSVNDFSVLYIIRALNLYYLDQTYYYPSNFIYTLQSKIRDYNQKPSTTILYSFHFGNDLEIVYEQVPTITDRFAWILADEPNGLESDYELLRDIVPESDMVLKSDLEILGLYIRLAVARRAWATGEPWWVASLRLLR